jgi:hypothetical protein
MIRAKQTQCGWPAAARRRQSLLARGRGGAEKSQSEPIWGPASRRLRARYASLPFTDLRSYDPKSPRDDGIPTRRPAKGIPSSSRGWLGSGSGERNMQNEPNVPPRTGRQGPGRSRLCKTKPIGRTNRAKQSQTWAPLGYLGAGAGGSNRAKQSQFLPERQERQTPCRKRVMVNWTRARPRRNKANLRPDGGGRGSAWPPVPLLAATMANKANSLRVDRQTLVTGVAGADAAGYKRAKQSQFLPGHQERQTPCRKGVMVNWTPTRPRKNKANLRPDGTGRGRHGCQCRQGGLIM